MLVKDGIGGYKGHATMIIWWEQAIVGSGSLAHVVVVVVRLGWGYDGS